MTDKVRAVVHISGTVQGVFFRQETRRQAGALGLSGWVTNLADGRVQAVFEGREEAVQAAIDWCKKGPPQAIVEAVDVRFEPTEGIEGFGIR